MRPSFFLTVVQVQPKAIDYCVVVDVLQLLCDYSAVLLAFFTTAFIFLILRIKKTALLKTGPGVISSIT